MLPQTLVLAHLSLADAPRRVFGFFLPRFSSQ